MKKIIFSILLALTFACQEKKESKTETPQKDTIIKKKDVSKAEKTNVKNAPDYAKLILGRWVIPEKDKFEPWSFYDAEKVYSDGNEQGTEYQIEGDKMIYRVLGGGEPAEYKILELTEKKLVIQINKDLKETWTKSDNKTTDKSKK